MKFFFVLQLLLRLGSVMLTSLFPLSYVTGEFQQVFTPRMNRFVFRVCAYHGLLLTCVYFLLTLKPAGCLAPLASKVIPGSQYSNFSHY